MLEPNSIILSGPESKWMGLFQIGLLSTQNTHFTILDVMWAQSSVIEIKTFADKRSHQQLMCINQHSSDTLYGILSPTINVPISGCQEFPGSYWMKVTFHFVLQGLFLSVTDVWGNIPFWLQIDLSMAIKGKYKAVGRKEKKKKPRHPCAKQPQQEVISTVSKREVHLKQETSHVRACTESHVWPFFISLISE